VKTVIGQKSKFISIISGKLTAPIRLPSIFELKPQIFVQRLEDTWTVCPQHQ
jgi:hypothetical protein